MLKILALASLCILCGCAGRNIAKGDGDYPVENINPRSISTISGKVPEDLDVSFKAVWKASDNESCTYDVAGGNARIYYSVLTPLSDHRNGDRFSVPVAVDHYLPGRCNWLLSVVQLFVARGNGYPSQVDIYYFDHERTAARKINVWCKKSKSPNGDGKDWGRCSTSKAGAPRGVFQPTSLLIRKYDPGLLELAVQYDE